MSEPIRIDRRTTIKWMLAATAALPAMQSERVRGSAHVPPAQGYGTDPDLHPDLRAGRSLAADASRTASGVRPPRLCDVIIPADAGSPSASAVGVVDFLDEWISAPYAPQQQDRKIDPRGSRVAR